jgi:integrase
LAKEPIRKVVLSDGKTIRYRLVVDIGTDPETGKRKQYTGTFDKLKEAQAKLAEIRHERNTGMFVAPSKKTLAEYLEVWYTGHCRGLEEGTRYAYRQAMRAPIERLGHRELQTIEKADIEELVEWMQAQGRMRGRERRGDGLGPRSVQSAHSVLKMALDMAVAERKIGYNPARLVKPPKLPKSSKVPWTADEVRTFLDAIKGERLYAVMFLALMGLRPEEVCGLKWPKVDLDRGTVTIDWARTLVGGKPVEKETKSDAGERPLPLPTAPWNALRTLKARQAVEKLAAGKAYAVSEDGGYVLCDEIGRPMNIKMLRYRYNKLIESAGVRLVTLYDARHACLTYLAVSGVPDVVVSAWAGHADLAFTKRRYVHPNPEDLAAGRDALDRLFGT